jgi:hypothetical protein
MLVTYPLTSSAPKGFDMYITICSGKPLSKNICILCVCHMLLEFCKNPAKSAQLKNRGQLIPPIFANLSGMPQNLHSLTDSIGMPKSVNVWVQACHKTYIH